jgi:transposase
MGVAMSGIQEYWDKVRSGEIKRDIPPKQLSDKLIKEASKLYEQGYTYEFLADMYGVSITTIRMWIGRYHGEMIVPVWAKAARALREKGLSYEQIGKELGKSRQRIHQILSLMKGELGDNQSKT